MSARVTFFKILTSNDTARMCSRRSMGQNRRKLMPKNLVCTYVLLYVRSEMTNFIFPTILCGVLVGTELFKLRLELVVFVLVIILKKYLKNSVGRSRALPEILRLSILPVSK